MSKQFKYDVALSFANEDKAVADALSQALQSYSINLSVFNYREKRALQFGRSLMKRSIEVYTKKARHVVILVSKHYDTQGWASIEWKLIKDESRSRPYRYLWVVKIDESKLNGLDEDVVYETWQDKAMELANLFKQVYDADLRESKKVEKNIRSNRPFWEKDWVRHFLIPLIISLATAAITGLYVQMSENQYLSWEVPFIHQKVIESNPKAEGTDSLKTGGGGSDKERQTPDSLATLVLKRSGDYANMYIFINGDTLREFRKRTERIEHLKIGDIVSVGSATRQEKVITINEHHINQKTIEHELY